jgi:hypothetical protein
METKQFMGGNPPEWMLKAIHAAELVAPDGSKFVMIHLIPAADNSKEVALSLMGSGLSRAEAAHSVILMGRALESLTNE